MKIADAFVGVDHRDGWASGEGGSDVGFDRGFFVGGKLLEFFDEVAEAVVKIDAELGEGGGVFCEHVLEENADGVAE